MGIIVQTNTPATPLSSPSFTLSFGAADPQATITAITSPTCGYCQAPFLAYYDLLELYPDRLRLEVVFSVPYTHADNLATKVATTIINIYQTNPAKALEAAKAWYAHRDEANWLAEYGAGEAHEATTQQLAASMDWCRANEYSGTPVTLLDGYKYPRVYDTKDLRWLLVEYMPVGVKEET
uniref:DsbA family protein n=1 Tax=Fulvivirga sp. TaxID=1931237 RepID=UPI0040499723